MCSHDIDEPVRNCGKSEIEEDKDMFDTCAPPVFVELLLRMIEESPDTIISWSIEGGSFVVKQIMTLRGKPTYDSMPSSLDRYFHIFHDCNQIVTNILPHMAVIEHPCHKQSSIRFMRGCQDSGARLSMFEALLPTYYGHGKFSSFTRQLNYYGFRRARRTPSPRLSSTSGDGQGAAAATAATTRGLIWDEFSHPLFRRGRRDLMVGINRHKDGELLKPPKADVEELDMLNSLREDVGALSGDLEAANGKVARIMSLLSDVAGGQIQTDSNNTGRGVGVGGGRGGGRCFPDGEVAGSAAAPAVVVRGGSVGFGGWIGGGGQSDGGTHGGSQEWGVGGEPPGYFVAPGIPMGHQQQGLGLYPVYPPSSHKPSSTQRYPAGPHQVRYGEALPPLAEALSASASEGALAGPSRQQKPPNHHPR